MACKFHAVSRASSFYAPGCHLNVPVLHRLRAVFVLGAVSAFGAPLPAAHAERADRFKPLQVEAGSSGKIDLLNQHVVFNGNVVVTKGTMVIRAARIEVRELPDGYYSAVAFGSPGEHATFRQKRDEPNEFMAGDAERLEYDGKSDVVRFVNNATVRRLRGSEVSDEITGNLVTYDSATEVINSSGGAKSTVTNPTGRVRVTLTPKPGTAAASEAEAAASAAPLKTAPALGAKP